MFHRHVTSLMSKFCHLTSQFQTKKRQKPWLYAGISFRSAWEPSWCVTGDWQATQPAAVIQKGLSPKSWLEFLSRFWPLVCGLGLALFVGRFWQSIIFLHSSFQTGKIFWIQIGRSLTMFLVWFKCQTSLWLMSCVQVFQFSWVKFRKSWWLRMNQKELVCVQHRYLSV